MTRGLAWESLRPDPKDKELISARMLFRVESDVFPTKLLTPSPPISESMKFNAELVTLSPGRTRLRLKSRVMKFRPVQSKIKS